MIETALGYWTYLLFGVVVGATAASIITILIHRKTSSHVAMKTLQTQLDELRSEHDEYKRHVRTHFVDVAALLHNVNESHKQLYESMASSVSVLCPSEDADTPEALTQKIEALTQKLPVKETREEAVGSGSKPTPMKPYPEEKN